MEARRGESTRTRRARPHRARPHRARPHRATRRGPGGPPLRLVLLTVAILALTLGAAAPAGAAAPYRVSAWTYGNLASLDAACDRGALDEVNPDWWVSRRDGSVYTGDDDPGFVAAARARGLHVLPTVSNWNPRLGDFDPAIAAAILANPASSAAHAALLADLCVTRGYDGLDLDWESLAAVDRDPFSAFVEELAARLHAQGKLCSIAVHAKASEPGDWSGAKAQDWLRLGAAVDEFKIMTYDYSGGWSGPGPISPPGWIDRVLAFAESEVAAARISMGVPFYGYDWGGGRTRDVTWSRARALIARYHPAIERTRSRETRFRYRRHAVRHVVYFQDRTALAAKLDVLLGKHPDIAGIAIWRMGGEDPRFWGVIAARLK